ncbi:MAG: hypothetical protein EVA58_01085 [Kiritimatiellaceae bacterium]|nr:MAG: hypothetical protein EVA58_01085 [Kiritimatiellaceae bacterium]
MAHPSHQHASPKTRTSPHPTRTPLPTRTLHRPAPHPTARQPHALPSLPTTHTSGITQLL